MNSVSSASAGALRDAGSEFRQRIGSVDHQGRSSPGHVYNPPGIMLANLRALFGVVVDIVLLRRGPEHLPASPALLAVTIAAKRRRVRDRRPRLFPRLPEFSPLEVDL